MRRKVCYTFRRMVFHAINRLNALKEGFIGREWKKPEGRSCAGIFPAENTG